MKMKYIDKEYFKVLRIQLVTAHRALLKAAT